MIAPKFNCLGIPLHPMILTYYQARQEPSPMSPVIINFHKVQGITTLSHFLIDLAFAQERKGHSDKLAGRKY